MVAKVIAMILNGNQTKRLTKDPFKPSDLIKSNTMNTRYSKNTLGVRDEHMHLESVKKFAGSSP